MNNQNNNGESSIGQKIFAFIVTAALIIGLTCWILGDSGSSGKKWSDLSDQEKDNARWAYQVQEEINNR